MMNRVVLFLVFVVAQLSQFAWAFEIESETFFPAISSSGNSSTDTHLDILSTADIDQFESILKDFQEKNPLVSVRYVAVGSTDLMAVISQQQAVFDIAISSAMDLHTKLANDGFALAYESAETNIAPDFARWRNEVFTFTEEPAAIVVSPKAFEGINLPSTRQELITALRQHPERFRGKIGTYDVRESGLGYLFASQDARNSETYWRLTELMGSLGVKTYCCSSKMISDVASGEISLAYNVLGSYAATREELGAPIQIILPEDYTLLMQRSVLIPKESSRPQLAGKFIDHLLQLAWQSTDTDVYPFPRMSSAGAESTQSHLPIRLGPGLLVFLDSLKRVKFIEEWEDSILQ